MRQINFDVEPKRGDASFVLIYANGSRPWETHVEAAESARALEMSRILLLNRSDGDMGFVGGLIEDGYSAVETAAKEVKEEIGLTIDHENLHELVAHETDQGKRRFAYRYEIEPADMPRVISSIVSAEHFGSEITGFNFAHVYDYDANVGKWGGLGTLLRNEFPSTVVEQMAHLLVGHSSMTKAELEVSFESAGYDLNALLR